MKYIKLKNAGEIDLRLVALMGGTTKRKFVPMKVEWAETKIPDPEIAKKYFSKDGSYNSFKSEERLLEIRANIAGLTKKTEEVKRAVKAWVPCQEIQYDSQSDCWVVGKESQISGKKAGEWHNADKIMTSIFDLVGKISSPKETKTILKMRHAYTNY